mgnify:CR=1 FL=1
MVGADPFMNLTPYHLIFSAVTDDGQVLEEDAARKLLSLPGQVKNLSGKTMPSRLDERTQQQLTVIRQEIAERNAVFFEAEVKKLGASQLCTEYIYSVQSWDAPAVLSLQ